MLRSHKGERRSADGLRGSSRLGSSRCARSRSYLFQTAHVGRDAHVIRSLLGTPRSRLRIVARRFAQNPIITPDMLPGTDGKNINGPSLVLVPDWLPKRLGQFYLYFAHHRGGYIRLAFADRLEGPWKIHEAGTLRLEEAIGCREHPRRPSPRPPSQSQDCRGGGDDKSLAELVPRALCNAILTPGRGSRVGVERTRSTSLRHLEGATN